jgi:hypothetical protein
MKLRIITVVIFIVSLGNIIAQWEPDVRLTNNAAFSGYPSVSISGSVVHIVWEDNRDGNSEIYYKHSTDGGISWGSDTRLTNNSALSQSPSVSVSGSVVHVLWEDERDGNFEIYYKRSTDGGITWGGDTRLTNNSFISLSPSVSAAGSLINVVWFDYRDGSPEIYYKRSTDGGINWEADFRLTVNSAASVFPSVSLSGSLVHVVWAEERDGNLEIYHKRSVDGGISWGGDTRLTNNPDNSHYPSVSASGLIMHVVWQDNRDGNYEIYNKRSTDGGISWEADTRLTNNSAFSLSPSVVVSDSMVHVVWYDELDGNQEIYYKRSTDGGISWEADIRLTVNMFGSQYPSVSVSGSIVYVLWSDNRDGNFEIYYKRDPSGNVTEIENIVSELPQDFRLEQNYPNPFNPSTTIKFSIPEQSFVKLEVFNTLGEKIATLVSEELKAGNYKYDWNAENFSSGVYYYKLIANDFSQTKKLILLK